MVPVAGVEVGHLPRKEILSTTTEITFAMLLESKEMPSKRPLIETNVFSFGVGFLFLFFAGSNRARTGSTEG